MFGSELLIMLVIWLRDVLVLQDVKKKSGLRKVRLGFVHWGKEILILSEYVSLFLFLNY